MVRGRLCSSQHNIVRNRRLAALQDLYSEGQYFSDKQMERRDPLLYYRLWGRYASYLKSSELEQIRNNDSLAHIYPSKVNLSNASEEAAINKEISEDVVQSTRKGEPSRPLTDYLMEYFDAKDIVVKRMEQRREEKDNTKTKRLSFGFHNAFGQMKSETEYVEEQLMEQASDEENEGDISQWTLEDFQQCREELIVAMRQRFLNGEDTAFFDYSTVDNNEHYDWADWIQNDVEENYFDRQEPQRISFMEQDEHSTEE